MSERTRLVALDLPPGPDLVAALARYAERREAVLPLDATAPRERVQRLLEGLRPDAVLGPDGVEHALPDPLPTPAGTAVVIATSGTMGAPKAVVLSAAALDASWRAAARRLGVQAGDRWLACLPPHHIAGFSVLWRARLSGLAPVVVEPFDVGAVEEALRDAALASVVPTQLHRLLEAGVDLAGLRALLVGGARIPQDLLARARAAGAPVVTTYGMTETCGGCVYDGRPLDGVEVAADADGRLRIRGPMLLTGYRRPDEPLAPALDDGWFRTSDLGRVDEAGVVHVTGRADDVIITGGVNVVAGEVEAVLASLPGVAEVAVFGRDDPEWGQRVVAAVLPADPAAPPASKDLRAAVRDRLGAPAAPREVLVVADLPRLPNGKVDRRALGTLPPA